MKPTEKGHLPTLGGKQFWTDWRWADGWRLQRLFLGNLARILDAKNRLVKLGRFEDCHEFFQAQLASGVIAEPQGKVVILLHGLCRTRTSLRKLETRLQNETELTPVRLSWASTRQTLEQNAMALRFLIDHWKNVDEINFVCHSMGNLLVRRLLHDAGKQLPPIRRFVMIAPPNQGSRMARWLKFSLIFNSIAGVGGRQFSWNWNRVSKQLAIPDCEFAIIAGAQQHLRWMSNPFLPGTDDWTVSTDETRLNGESDRLEGSFLHSSIMAKREVIDATIRFLQTGSFESSTNAAA